MKQLSELTDDEFSVLSAVVSALKDDDSFAEQGSVNGIIATLLEAEQALDETQLNDLRETVRLEQQRRDAVMPAPQLTDKQRMIQKLLEP